MGNGSNQDSSNILRVNWHRSIWTNTRYIYCKTRFKILVSHYIKLQKNYINTTSRHVLVYSSISWSLIHFVATHFSPRITAQLPWIDVCIRDLQMSVTASQHAQYDIMLVIQRRWSSNRKWNSDTGHTGTNIITFPISICAMGVVPNMGYHSHWLITI